MRDILTTCQPRPEILGGTFNPEIFTASLSRVLSDYRSGEAYEGAGSLYSDPVAFFRDATHPTQGLCTILDNALARLVNRDLSRPAIQRLDTAFGGGKTHALIALAHAAKRGKALAQYTKNIIAADCLPQPEQVRVVGIIGDTVDTVRESDAGSTAKQPNTLWWLIAQQTLAPEQQTKIRTRLEDASAPASDEFFAELFGDQPTLIIIDEIAQYLSRMEAAFPGIGAQQTAAFLMSLSTYAAGKANLAVVLSLASTGNAFGDFNKLIRTLQDQHNMTAAAAEAVVREAQRGVLDVVNRTAEATIPVQQGDLSRIMAKRLFTTVDLAAAEEVAAEFIDTYRQAGTELPAAARDPQLHERLVAHYPFHPTLIEFLSEKLAQVESFQGTRGLLRTLARTVRRLWESQRSLPLIQTGHIDLADRTIRAELLGKTDNTSLETVLDADISKVSGTPDTGRTVAGDLDAANPHPDGYPVHEWAWRVVFLHSLVGQDGGLQNKQFGISMVSAVYEIASPMFKPAAARSALEAIEREANYLRHYHNRLYADTLPTLNNILRRIEVKIDDEQALSRVEQVVRELLKSAVFKLYPNIDDSASIPDADQQQPQLGVIAFEVATLEPAAWIERCGERVRQYQNQVMLLAPSTTHITAQAWSETRNQQAHRSRQNILHLARKTLALERLKHNPDNWSVSHEALQRPEFTERMKSIPGDLRTAVDEVYRVLIYSGQDGGRAVIRDLGKRGGGSSGLHLEDAIVKQLSDEGKLITEDRASTAETLALVGKLFFDQRPQIHVGELKERFATQRHWPLLQRPVVLTVLVIEGTKRGYWCLGHMPNASDHKPALLYHKDQPPPLTADPLEQDGAEWMLCTLEHAKQLGWLERIVRDPNTVAAWIQQTIAASDQVALDQLQSLIEEQHDRVDPQVLSHQLDNLFAQQQVVAYPAAAFDADGKPDPTQAVIGNSALPRPTSGIVMSHRYALERGWIAPTEVKEQAFDIKSPAAITQLFNLLSGVALSDSATQVKTLMIAAETPDQARFHLSISATTVGELVTSRALFAALNHRLRFTSERHGVQLVVAEPSAGCKLIAILENITKESNG